MVFSIPSKQKEDKMGKNSVFRPKEDKIIVDPIMRVRNALITDPEHEAFFLFGTATNSYCLPVDRQNNLVDPFESEGEKLWLEEVLDLDLNHHKRKENFFRTHKVKLGKEPRTLDLSNPKDYLDYVILRANKRFISPDGDSAKKKATYKYALIKESYKEETKAKSADVKIECYMALGELKKDKEQMLNFLKVYGKRVSSDSKKEFLTSELLNIIENAPKEFLEIYEDKDNYELRLLISEAVEHKVINKNGRKYTLPGGDKLCGESEVPVLANVIEFLKSPANQDLVLSLSARVKKAKED